MGAREPLWVEYQILFKQFEGHGRRGGKQIPRSARDDKPATMSRQHLMFNTRGQLRKLQVGGNCGGRGTRGWICDWGRRDGTLGKCIDQTF